MSTKGARLYQSSASPNLVALVTERVKRENRINQTELRVLPFVSTCCTRSLACTASDAPQQKSKSDGGLGGRAGDQVLLPKTSNTLLDTSRHKLKYILLK